MTFHGKLTRMLHVPAVEPQQTPTLPPVHHTVGFRFKSYAHAEDVFAGRVPGLIGARGGSPTVQTLEAKLAVLDGAEAALVVPSGMAAVTAGLMAFAKAGDAIVVDRVLYVGTHGLLKDVLPQLGIEVRAVDTTNLAEVEAAIDVTVRTVFVESPGSWQLKVPDLAALAEVAHSRGAKLVVDGTHATGYLQQPLALGADLAVYSASGLLNGHGDAVLGAVVGSAETIGRLRATFRNEMGAAVSSSEAWLVSRALATLGVRMRQQCATARMLAERLEGTSGVCRVLYPTLPSHPQYAVAVSQLRAGGAMVYFDLAYPGMAPRFVDALQVCAFSVGVGGPLTTVFLPAHSYPGLSRGELERRGVNECLVRISVGLEDAEDVIADVEQALEHAQAHP